MTLLEKIKAITQEIQEQYLRDDTPWVLGYSGGKDSTAVLQNTPSRLNCELPLPPRFRITARMKNGQYIDQFRINFKNDHVWKSPEHGFVLAGAHLRELKRAGSNSANYQVQFTGKCLAQIWLLFVISIYSLPNFNFGKRMQPNFISHTAVSIWLEYSPRKQ